MPGSCQRPTVLPSGSRSASDIDAFWREALPQARSIRSTPIGVANSERAWGVDEAVGHEKRRIVFTYRSSGMRRTGQFRVSEVEPFSELDSTLPP